MKWGDIPAWVALGVALTALAVSWRSMAWQKQSAQAAVQSANEAARANLIAERALEARAADASDRLDGQADHRPPHVAWRLEKGDGAAYVLRNVGTDVAEHVYAAEISGLTRNLPQDSVVRPGAGHKMMLKGSMQHPLPTEINLRWAGQDDWVAVPLRE